MTAEVLSAVAGIVLSLVLSYVPGLNVKYAALEASWKRLIMLGLLLLVAVGVFGLSCAGWGAAWNINVECSQAGAQALIAAFVMALIANQSAYLISPETSKVRAAKAAKK